MTTPLAWLNLLHNKSRTIVAVAGVTFSILLIFMQLGFLGAVANTATMVFNGMEFDIVIRSPKYVYLVVPHTVPYQRIGQSAAIRGVEWARPFHANVFPWRHEDPHPVKRTRRAILCLGFDPDAPIFTVEEIAKQADALRDPGTLLVDRRSRKSFGPANKKTFSDQDIGMRPEIADQEMRVVGHFQLGTGLASDGSIVMSERSFHKLFRGQMDDQVSMVMVKIKEGESPEIVAERIEQSLPKDVEVLTRAEANKRERDRWLYETSIGTIFLLGVAMAVVVGMAIVYQVLSSDIEDMMPQYATLKAMGYSNGYLARIVIQQGLFLAVVSFIPGFLISWGLYWIVAAAAYLPIEMTFERFCVVFGLAVLICTTSGLGALRKVQSADPADLF